MADLNTMQPAGEGGGGPKSGKGIIIGIIVVVVLVLALIVFWPRGDSEVEQAIPAPGEPEAFDDGTDFNTGVGTEDTLPPANDEAFPGADQGLEVEF